MVQFFGTNYEPEINYYYVVMEHVETGSLEEYLKVRRRRRRQYSELFTLIPFRTPHHNTCSEIATMTHIFALGYNLRVVTYLAYGS